MIIEKFDSVDYGQLKRKNTEKIENYTVGIHNGNVDFYPRYIQIEQTNRCNARCIMCNHFYLSNKGASDISNEVLKKIEGVLPFCETVMLNGDGEPFLSSNIVDNIKRISSFGIKIGTNTNLCYVPEELWWYLKNDFKFLNISCDGATLGTYEMIRRGLSYDCFVANLARLDKMAPKLKKSIDCVIMKQNIIELSDIVQLASNYGIDCVKFHRLGINPCIGNQNDDAEYYYAKLMDSLYEAEELGRRLGIKVCFPFFEDRTKSYCHLDKDSFAAEIEKRFEQSCLKYGNLSLENDYYSELVTVDEMSRKQWFAGKNCQWAIERCYIDLKGNVTTCCFNMKKYMGNLLLNTFDEIWNGETYKELRKMMTAKALPDFCRNCNWIKEACF